MRIILFDKTKMYAVIFIIFISFYVISLIIANPIKNTFIGGLIMLSINILLIMYSSGKTFNIKDIENKSFLIVCILFFILGFLPCKIKAVSVGEFTDTMQLINFNLTMINYSSIIFSFLLFMFFYMRITRKLVFYGDIDYNDYVY